MAVVGEFMRTIRYCKPQWRNYAIANGALVIVDVLDVAAPVLIMYGVNAATRWGQPGYEPSPLERLLPDGVVSPENAWHGMWAFGLAYFIVVGLAGYFRFWMSLSISKATINITNGLRNRFFGHIQRLPARWHDHSTVGNVMSLATNDMEACRFFWGFGVLLLADVVLYLVFTPVMMFAVSWELTLVCFITVPLIPMAISRVARRIEREFETVQEQFSVLSGQASESFNGTRVIKSFAAEDQDVERYAKLSREYRKRALRLAFFQRLEDPLLMLFLGIMQLTVLGYGGWLTLEGEMSPGEFVGFFFLVMRLAFPMTELGFVIALFQRCIVSRRRIEAILAIEPEIASPKGGGHVPPGGTAAGAIEIRGLTFAYKDGAEPALRDVTLAVPAGSTLGIVGEVGSGKSTLAALLPRLYDPPPGTVFLDGVDVREWRLEELRGAVASVPQETFLFSEPIIENILYGVPAERRDVEKAKAYARLARVEADILAFPRGYDTLLGERGVNLSGGQKQRVAIARALACEPAVLVLDDCLSAVDAETEEAILRGLRKETRRRTSLIVSHRVSAVKHCDRIIVLDRGRVAEQGTHAELVKLDGWYADLCRKQALEAEIDSTA